MNVKISQKLDNVYYIRNHYTLKFIYDDENECINYTLSGSSIILHNQSAYDVIIFLNGCKASIRGPMSMVSRYKNIVGQLVNASKSSFIVAPSTTMGTIYCIQDLMGFSHGHLSFGYLGCPIS